jgi:hypothetical protein
MGYNFFLEHVTPGDTLNSIDESYMTAIEDKAVYEV